MATFYLAFLVAFCLTTTWGLQVTPNSKCASVCMDDPTQDPSDPNVSNTYGSDIVCKDDDYTFTAVGQKFETCLNCLQNSTAIGSGESDLGWYLYNLRFAINTCVFGTANATDPITIPCSLDTACGPIEGALLDGMSNTATLQMYSYCSSFDNSFLGSFLGTCSNCLFETIVETFFGNFLTALHAGCLQQPTPGNLLGLNSTVFTTDRIEITSPRTNLGNKSHKILTPAALVGIAAGGVVICLIIGAIIFVCMRKRRNIRRFKSLNSPLDSRFGAKNISAPHDRDYASPDNSPPLTKEDVPMQLTKPKPMAKAQITVEATSSGQRPIQGINFSRQSPLRNAGRDDDLFGGETLLTSPAPPPTKTTKAKAAAPPTTPPTRREPIIPTHAAYIPPHTRAPSRASEYSRNSYVPPPQPPPTSHPQRPPSANQMRSSSPVQHSNLSRAASNASAWYRDGSRDRTRDTSVERRQDSGVVGRTRDSSTGRVRDGSVGRFRHRSPPRGNLGNPVQQISGPIIKVGKRFETEDDARKARERLYKEGLGRTMTPDADNKKIIEEGVSPESEHSGTTDEMWPGNY